jgi:hypothetical protein
MRAGIECTATIHIMMKATGRLLAAAILALTGAGVAHAGLNAWTSNGPNGPGAGTVLALAIDPLTPSTLYAGTYAGGIYKTTNSGGSWSADNGGLGVATSFWALAIDPATPSTLYAGSQYTGAFKSADGGASWNAASAGLSGGGLTLRALAIDPLTPSTLYAGTSGGGVYQSTNSAGSWNAINTGFLVATDLSVYALAIDPLTPSTLYAGTGGGVYQSTNSGGSWSEVLLSSSGAVQALAIDPLTPSTLYAGTEGGVYQSSNSGATWSAINTGLTGGLALDVFALAIDPLTPSTLYAGTGGGVYQSTNSGGSWSAINTGLAGFGVASLAIDPVTPSTLYAGTNGGGVYEIEIICPAEPAPSCNGAAKSNVLLKNGAPTLSWSWGKGIAPLFQSNFGSPVDGGTSYHLCVYDESGGTAALKMWTVIPAGGTCGSRLCWKALGTSGWSFNDRRGGNYGITRVTLKGGAAGKPSIKLFGKGPNLPLPVPVSSSQFFNQDAAVIVQLSRSDASTCWISTFGPAGTTKNTGTAFRAKAP